LRNYGLSYVIINLNERPQHGTENAATYRKLLTDFERGGMTRRQLASSLAALY
jgi:hypothetical protein